MTEKTKSIPDRFQTLNQIYPWKKSKKAGEALFINIFGK